MPLDKAIIARAVQVLSGQAVMAIVFFIAAGRFDITSAWFFYGMAFIHLAFNLIIFYKLAPDIIRERSQTKPGIRPWDLAFAISFTLSVMAIHAVAGLDIGRFGWSNPGPGFGVLGILLYAIGASIVTWAMVANKFFETTVTIVKGHQVASGGPYAYIRHPGYVGMILLYCSPPLVLGSAVSLIPAAIVVFLFVGRTYMEDKTLQVELKGYKEYAKKVRFRLIPGIW
jgi:protein-S-isoprenylcysteine O-methyltransferase Ste14